MPIQMREYRTLADFQDAMIMWITLDTIPPCWLEKCSLLLAVEGNPETRRVYASPWSVMGVPVASAALSEPETGERGPASPSAQRKGWAAGQELCSWCAYELMANPVRSQPAEQTARPGNLFSQATRQHSGHSARQPFSQAAPDSRCDQMSVSRAKIVV